MFKGVNVCVYVGEGLRRSFATPDPFVLTNKICLNQVMHRILFNMSNQYSLRTGILPCRHTTQLCSGITLGRVLSGEPYAQRFQKLIYLHLFTDCFMRIFPQSLEQIQNC